MWARRAFGHNETQIHDVPCHRRRCCCLCVCKYAMIKFAEWKGMTYEDERYTNTFIDEIQSYQNFCGNYSKIENHYERCQGAKRECHSKFSIILYRVWEFTLKIKRVLCAIAHVCVRSFYLFREVSTKLRTSTKIDFITSRTIKIMYIFKWFIWPKFEKWNFQHR